MHIEKIIYLFIVCCIYSQDYTYSLEDINITSEYYGNNLSPTEFPNQVTLHYFGHQN